MNKKQKNILRAYRGQKTENGQGTPWWCMRQAGRYLPEYRELRAKAGGFLDLVYDSEKASEVTLQPIRRFGMDGAILFSDILVVPHALGQKVTFEAGEGPKLEPVRSDTELTKLDLGLIDERLSPVYETVSKVREKLRCENFDHTALIGFCGGPWTVACYMVEGGSSKDEFARVKNFMAGEVQCFSNIIDLVTSASIHYLLKQIEAGCEAVQIFESWAGLLDEPAFENYVIKPTRRIVQVIREKHPHIPVIGFPRAAGELIRSYAQATGIDAVGLDYTVPLDFAADLQKEGFCVQGNLDPARLMTGGPEMRMQVENILKALSAGPFVFNLGHGVIKETPPEHMGDLADMIRDFKS